MNIDELIQDRQKKHGKFDEYAAVAQLLKNAVAGHREQMPTYVNEGLDMIFSKVARIATGDPLFKDHWHDIQGYAKAVENVLPDETISEQLAKTPTIEQIVAKQTTGRTSDGH